MEIVTANFEKTLIGMIYRSPEYSNLDVFYEYIQTVLHRQSNTRIPSFIMGDFNTDMLNMTDTATTFINTMSSYYFKPNILNPTRLNNEGKFTSLIDYVLSNNDSFSGTMVYDISDHLPIFYSTY